MKTSIADKTPYVYAAYEAALSDEAFATFKQNPHYQQVLEHMTKEDGQKILDYLWSLNDTTMNEYIIKITSEPHINDKFGSPNLVSYNKNYQIKSISPSTIRYIKVLFDLENLDLLCENRDLVPSRLQIVEIGGGYGGQATVLWDWNKSLEFTMIDLKEALALQRKYLGNTIPNAKVNYISPIETEFLRESTFDLVISNYAFSECNREIQTKYIQDVIINCKHGYITWNFISQQHGIDSLSIEEFKAMLPFPINDMDEMPATGFNNKILWW